MLGANGAPLTGDTAYFIAVQPVGFRAVIEFKDGSHSYWQSEYHGVPSPHLFKDKSDPATDSGKIAFNATLQAVNYSMDCGPLIDVVHSASDIESLRVFGRYCG